MLPSPRPPPPRPTRRSPPSPSPTSGWRLNPPGRWYALRATAELGFVGVMKHGIQFGQQGTYFDFRNQGGQDVLFPFFRFTGEFAIKDRHSLIFLIQPLKLKSSATIDTDVQVDGTRFAAGTPMAFKYDFGFYRFGYMYDLLKHPEQELGVGVALQIRNATIDFASRDGRAPGHQPQHRRRPAAQAARALDPAPRPGLLARHRDRRRLHPRQGHQRHPRLLRGRPRRRLAARRLQGPARRRRLRQRPLRRRWRPGHRQHPARRHRRLRRELAAHHGAEPRPLYPLITGRPPGRSDPAAAQVIVEDGAAVEAVGLHQGQRLLGVAARQLGVMPRSPASSG
jgi:hypothetical protein